jgi:hypothetical protein
MVGSFSSNPQPGGPRVLETVIVVFCSVFHFSDDDRIRTETFQMTDLNDKF